ncbi:ABC transporter ATP-binding protein [bacterium]|nr:ABC transporter ATP-binding protein [bacterium]
MSDFFQEDASPAKAYDARLMRRLLAYLRPQRGRVVIAVVLLALGAGLGLAGPYLVKVAIDDGILAGNQGILLTVALLYLLFLGLEYAVAYGQAIVVAMLGQRFMYDLRMQLFAHMEKLSIRFFDRNPVGRLVTRMTGDVETLNEMFTGGLIAIFGDVFLLVGIMIFLLILNWRLALVTFSVLPFISIFTLFFRTRLRANFREVRKRIAAINAYLQERLSGISVIQIFGREESSLESFRELNQKHTKAHLDTVFNFSVFWPLVELTASVSIALILWYGGLRVMGGDASISLGALAAFIQYARRFFQPISDLSEKFNIMQAAMAASERVFGILDTVPEIRAPKDPVAMPECKGEIKFEGLHFHYEEEKAVLRGLDLHVKPGERLAMVGLTGSGKTTLLSLLLRFYDPVKGRILLDDVDLRQLAPGDLRRHLALVQQDVFLFPGTVAENIHLGDPKISMDRVREAAETVGAHRFIERMSEGYETRLEERGGGLSTGQKQLIAFARALAFDPAILILDEATSSVDSETEQWIQEGLERLLTGRTSLTVAHRLSTIRAADRIIVMHHGELLEEGRHEELLRKDGLYRHLYELQFADQERVNSRRGA